MQLLDFTHQLKNITEYASQCMMLISLYYEYSELVSCAVLTNSY